MYYYNKAALNQNQNQNIKTKKRFFHCHQKSKCFYHCSILAKWMTATNAAHPLFGHLQLSLCVLLLDVVVLHLHLMSELQPFLQGVRRRPAAARLQFLLCPLQGHTHLQVAPEKNQIRVQSRSSCKPHKATFRWEHFLIR